MTKRGGMMRYVSNAGVVLALGGQAVGIDVFCRDPHGLYPDTPPDIRRELLEEIERRNLQTLIFTHEHGDHFCREDVEEARRRNPALRIISTIPVIEVLGGRRDGLRPIEREETALGPLWLELGEFRLGFLHSVHEGEQYANVENLTLLIEAAGQKWVVPGDAAPDRGLFERIAAWRHEIDWLFVPFPYVGLRSARRLLGETLEIRQLFVLHQPRREADEQNWRQQARQMCQRARDALPMPVFPEEPGGWYKL